MLAGLLGWEAISAAPRPQDRFWRLKVGIQNELADCYIPLGLLNKPEMAVPCLLFTGLLM